MMPRFAFHAVGLVVLALAIPVASAQSGAPSADSLKVLRDSVVAVETVLPRSRTPINGRIDTVHVRTRRGKAPARAARLAFPTEGGVFYYRAGSGGAFQRVRSDRQTPAVGSAEVTPEGVPQATREAIPTPPARAGERGVPQQAAPSGVTQRDLDRLERRLLEALDRRTDRDGRARPAVVPAPRAGEERPAQPPRPPVTPRLVSPGDTLRPAPRAPLADDPEVTEAEVERAILDTGLFRTSRVFFAFGEADLLPVSRRVLDTIAAVLQRYPELRIEVGGHTDSVSSDAFNLDLSERRAGSVVAYLIARGIASDRLAAVGYGEASPVASNETETGRALNRRVEFVVLSGVPPSRP